MNQWNNAKFYERLLINLKKFEADVMQHYNLEGLNKEAIRPTKVYPMAKIKPLDINGFPVLQFAYDGVLPLYLHKREYNKLVRDYYFHCTLSAYDFKELEGFFQEAVIIGCQYFQDNKITDLDNRNFKYIQDAIKFSGVIRDDNWHNIWNMMLGFFDPEGSHVQVYVVERKHFGEFYNFLLEHHEKLKKTDNFLLKQDEFIKMKEEIHNEENEEVIDEEETEENMSQESFFQSLFSSDESAFR